MKIKTIYETVDGKIFKNEVNALEHEQEIKEKFLTTLSEIKTYCHNCDNCKYCMFYETEKTECLFENVPDDWNL